MFGLTKVEIDIELVFVAMSTAHKEILIHLIYHRYSKKSIVFANFMYLIGLFLYECKLLGFF